MFYRIKAPTPTRKNYRYQLAQSKDLKFSDGLITIESVAPSRVIYREVDFFDAHWGGATVLGAHKIWTDAIQGLVISDLSVKLKSENTELSSSQSLSKAKDQAERKQIYDCFEKRKPFSESEFLSR